MRRTHGTMISLLLATSLLAAPAVAQGAPEELRYRYSGVDYVFFGPSTLSELSAVEGAVRLVLPPRAEAAVWPREEQISEGAVIVRFQAPLNAREVWLFMARQLLRQGYAMVGAEAVENDRIASVFVSGERRLGLAVEREGLDVLEGYEFVVRFDLTPTESDFVNVPAEARAIDSEIALVDVVFDNLLRPQRVPAGAASEIFTPVNPLATAPRAALVDPVVVVEVADVTYAVYATSAVGPLDETAEVRLGPPRAARDVRVQRGESGAVLMRFESWRSPVALVSDVNRLLDPQGFELIEARRSASGDRVQVTFRRDDQLLRATLERGAARDGWFPYTLRWEVASAR